MYRYLFLLKSDTRNDHILWYSWNEKSVTMETESENIHTKVLQSLPWLLSCVCFKYSYTEHTDWRLNLMEKKHIR